MPHPSSAIIYLGTVLYLYYALTPAGTYFYYFLKQGHKSSNFNFSFSWNRFLDHKKLDV